MENIQICKNDNILVVAPHPDDESIACGGLLCKYGGQCDVVLLTDGCLGNPQWSEENTREIRKKEFKKAMKVANVNQIYNCGIKDRELNKSRNCCCRLDLSKYKFIFVPNSKEKHPDHRAAYFNLKIAVFRQKCKAQVFQYELWTPLSRPTHILNISYFMKNKIKLIKCYESQINELNYLDAIIGLNQYRGIMEHMKYAECYKKDNF